MNRVGQMPARGALAVSLAPMLVYLGLILTYQWLFLATKLSFLSVYPFPARVGIWLAALVPSLLALAAAFFLSRAALGALGAAGAPVFRFLVSMVVAALQTMLAVLVLDNFLYTMFEFGLKVLATSERRLAGFLVLLLFLALFRRRWRRLGEAGRVPGISGRQSRLVGLAVLATGTLAAVVVAGHDERPAAGHSPGKAWPNILIVSSDALEAEHMSAYGYERDTTPFLLSKKHEFLLAENSFTNSSVTRGSIGSLMTGKYPTTTRLFYSPDVLLGDDQFEHLPGMLTKRGYRALDMSVRWYADAKDFNLRGAFDQANFRTVFTCPGGLGLEWLCARFPAVTLLIEQVADRVLEKLQLISPMTGETAADPVRARPGSLRGVMHEDNARVLRVGQPKHYYHDDAPRIEEAMKFISSDTDRPFFVHLHMMGTHGPRYLFEEQVFSAGLIQTRQWQTEFYDDSILLLDRQIGAIYRFLERERLLESTVLVISSDHGTSWRVDTRLPLMIRFPGAAHAGVISANTQRIDLAPTLLDFLKLETPGWMEGRSLLDMADSPLPGRPIFSTWPAATITGKGERWVQRQPVAPFHSLGGVGVVVCDEVFLWGLANNSVNWMKAEGHTRPCGEGEAPGTGEFQTLVRSHLSQRGYNVDSLVDPEERTPRAH